MGDHIPDFNIGELIKDGKYGAIYQLTGSKEMVAYQMKSHPLSKWAIRKIMVLDNENIIKLFAYASDFLFSEFANCGTLENYLHGEEQLEYTVGDAINWSIQLAKGLEYLNSKDFLITNLSSKCLLLSNNYHSLKMNLVSMRSIPNRTHEYVAPEVLGNLSKEKCDVYSFGIILCELLTRKKPFYHIGCTTDSIQEYITSGELIAVSQFEILECPVIKFSLVCCDSIQVRPDVNMLETSLRKYKSTHPESLGKVLTADVGAVVDSRDIKIIKKTEQGSFQKVNWIRTSYKRNNRQTIYRECVIKEINNIATDADKVTSLKLARKFIQLRHNNVLNIYGINVDKKPAFLLMDYANNGSLHDYLYGEEQRKYSVDIALDWMYQAALGIYHLYRRIGVVQYILKPKNMILNYHAKTHLKICDFWPSEVSSLNGNLDSIYKAPEIFEVSGNTIEGIVYNFGIVMWELLSRKKPFYHLEDQSPHAINEAIKAGERPRISEIRSSKYDIVEPLIKSCWNKYPDMRPQYYNLEIILGKPICSLEDFERYQMLPININFLDIKLLEVIERGVYRAEWRGKKVAVKKYKDDTDIITMKSIANDIKLDLLFYGENILRLYGIAFDEEYSYILMEYSECGSLYNYLHGDEQREYSVNDGLEWMQQASEGIRELRELSKDCKGIVYNISTKNMMLFANFKVLKISDHYYPTDHETFMNDNPTTPYTAPEVALRGEYMDKSNVYSLGLVFWEIMSRKEPFHHLKKFSANMKMMKINEGERPSLNDIRKSDSKSIRHLIQKCWDHDANKRPTLKELCESLSDPKDDEFDVPETNINDYVTSRNDWEFLGAGGFGEVYKAILNDKVVAVKQFRDIADKSNEAELKAFKREAKQLSRVDHENIIKIVCHTILDKSAYIFMEYAECGSLYNYLHGEEKLEYRLSLAIDWMSQCLGGITYMHSITPKPMIHRDLKPQNLLLMDEYRTLKIGDFGTVTDRTTIMTQECGTAAYIAPEVMKGRRYSEKCDIYSFGIILWEVLTRKKPFYHLPNPIAEAIIFNVSNGKRPDVKDIIIKDKVEFQILIGACWDEDSVERPSAEKIILRNVKITKDDPII